MQGVESPIQQGSPKKNPNEPEIFEGFKIDQHVKGNNTQWAKLEEVVLLKQQATSEEETRLFLASGSIFMSLIFFINRLFSFDALKQPLSTCFDSWSTFPRRIVSIPFLMRIKGLLGELACLKWKTTTVTLSLKSR